MMLDNTSIKFIPLYHTNIVAECQNEQTSEVVAAVEEGIAEVVAMIVEVAVVVMLVPRGRRKISLTCPNIWTRTSASNSTAAEKVRCLVADDVLFD